MNSHVFTEAGDVLSFVGDFEGLYAEDKDPWAQGAESGPMAEYYAFSRARLINGLVRRGLRSGLEIGCGHGHVAAAVQRALCVKMVGLDVSPSAIERAKSVHPFQTFFVGDILDPGLEPRGPFDVAIWAQVLWYVLHDLRTAFENTLRSIRPGGLFVVSQAFLDEQRYGADVVNGFEGAVRLFQERDELRLIEARYDDSDRYRHHDGLLIFRVRDADRGNG